MIEGIKKIKAKIHIQILKNKKVFRLKHYLKLDDIHSILDLLDCARVIYVNLLARVDSAQRRTIDQQSMF